MKIDEGRYRVQIKPESERTEEGEKREVIGLCYCTSISAITLDDFSSSFPFSSLSPLFLHVYVKFHQNVLLRLY